MKKWIIALVALIAVNCFANRIDWMNKSAEENLADLGGSMETRGAEGEGLTTWQVIVTLDMATIHFASGDRSVGSSSDTINAARVALNDGFMHPVYSGETLNDPPYIDYDYDDQFLVGTAPISFVFEANSPLTSEELASSVAVHLGWTDEDTGLFTPIAYSDPVSLSWLNSQNMLHPAELGAVMWTKEWRPTDFYTSVPEPSTAILALLGVGLLFHRRKSTHA